MRAAARGKRSLERIATLPGKRKLEGFGGVAGVVAEVVDHSAGTEELADLLQRRGDRRTAHAVRVAVVLLRNLVRQGRDEGARIAELERSRVVDDVRRGQWAGAILDFRKPRDDRAREEVG